MVRNIKIVGVHLGMSGQENRDAMAELEEKVNEEIKKGVVEDIKILNSYSVMILYSDTYVKD